MRIHPHRIPPQIAQLNFQRERGGGGGVAGEIENHRYDRLEEETSRNGRHLRVFQKHLCAPKRNLLFRGRHGHVVAQAVRPARGGEREWNGKEQGGRESGGEGAWRSEG